MKHSKIINFCRKKSYKTIKKAWEISLYMFTQHGWYQTPYKCKFCKKYHTTKSYAQPSLSKDFIKGFNKWYGKEIL